MPLTEQQRVRRGLLEAARSHTEGCLAKHVANVEMLLRNPVGVPDHSDLLSTIEAELDKCAEYEGRLHILSSYFEDDGLHVVS